MTLHPQAEALLSALAEEGRPSVEELSITAAREQTAAIRDVQGEPADVAGVVDLLVPGGAGHLPVRVYRPGLDGGPRPLLVYFHGGGWVTGGLELVDRPLRRLANATGAVLANVEYRLAPETPFPGAAEDAYASVVALHERAAELGADPERLAVAGDSAGGNLAAVAALMARDRGGPRIGSQILMYPVTAPAQGSPFASYRENADGYLLTRASMLYYWDTYLADPTDAADPYAAPLNGTDLSGLPPALILTAQYDPLRDEGEAYGRRLREAGVPVTAERYPGMIHGFFWFPGVFDAFDRAVHDIAGELTARLRARPDGDAPVPVPTDPWEA